ncbi:matrixin family metalloprotease [Rhodohalobacter halophilus]|uniref:matrixin family metalloprotease n=1 Tax=Rhodohalobacter halophilus TaxID=1812810 RepID=UPI00083FAAA5|nr:matrixin family metalloprotease [Rhodohalobacter halophilus]
MTLTDLLKYSVILVIVLIAGWYFITYEKAERPEMHSDVGACSEPLTYRIGSIDSRFDVTEAEVLDAMQIAVSLWSDAVDRPLAYHSEEGDIDINFEYDERQKLVMGEMQFREQIESSQIRADQLQKEYERKKEAFDKKSEEYELLARRTTQELDSLNEWVREKNRNGGFTTQDEQVFERRRDEVEQLQDQVKRERRELDELAREVNQSVDRLNRMIDENNQKIDQYNEEYSGESRFTKATFRKTSSGGTITVNQFLSKRDLNLVLAHELGHALGLGHGENPESVMYRQMGGQDLFPILQLSAEDRRAILDKCK